METEEQEKEIERRDTEEERDSNPGDDRCVTSLRIWGEAERDAECRLANSGEEEAQMSGVAERREEESEDQTKGEMKRAEHQRGSNRKRYQMRVG